MSAEGSPYQPDVQIYVDEIVRKLKDGKAAIMVGAGFSRNVAPNQPFPDWKDLGNIIFEGLKNAKDIRNSKRTKNEDRFVSVLRLAGEFEAVYGRHALDELVKQSIPDTRYEPSQLHNRLLKLPWADVFTTNYDTFTVVPVLIATSKSRRIIRFSIMPTNFYGESKTLTKLPGNQWRRNSLIIDPAMAPANPSRNRYKSRNIVRNTGMNPHRPATAMSPPPSNSNLLHR